MGTQADQDIDSIIDGELAALESGDIEVESAGEPAPEALDEAMPEEADAPVAEEELAAEEAPAEEAPAEEEVEAPAPAPEPVKPPAAKPAAAKAKPAAPKPAPAPAPAKAAPAKPAPAAPAKAATPKPTAPAKAVPAKPAAPAAAKAAPTKATAAKPAAPKAKPAVDVPKINPDGTPYVPPAPKPAARKAAAQAVAKAEAAKTPAAKAATATKAAATTAVVKEAAQAAVAPESVALPKEPTAYPTPLEDGTFDPMSIYLIPLDKIKVPKERRQRATSDYEPEALKDLTETIPSVGLLNPIVVHPPKKAGGDFILDEGERRIAAYRVLGETGIEARILPSGSDEAENVMRGWVANHARKEVDPLSAAIFFKSMIDKKLLSNQAAIAKMTGWSNATVSNYLGMLELPKEVQERIRTKTLPVAEAISMVRNIKKAQAEAAAKKAQEEAAAKAKAEATAAAEEAGEDPAAAEAAGEEAAALEPAPAPVAPRGRPKARQSLRDLKSPSVPLSDGLEVIVHRQPDDSFDVEFSIRISVGEAVKFSADSFKPLERLAEALKTDVKPHAAGIAVGIEAAIRSLAPSAK